MARYASDICVVVLIGMHRPEYCSEILGPRGWGMGMDGGVPGAVATVGLV